MIDIVILIILDFTHENGAASHPPHPLDLILRHLAPLLRLLQLLKNEVIILILIILLPTCWAFLNLARLRAATN